MNILLFNGGTSNKNTKMVVDFFKVLCEKRGHTVTLLDDYFKDCINCQKCANTGICCFNDQITKVLSHKDNIDAVVIGTPIYFFHMSAKAKAFLDRLYPIDKSNLIFGLLCISGSIKEQSGVDLIVESILRTCDYCNSKFAGTFNKVTDDKYTGSLTDEDIECLNILVDNMEDLIYEIKENK